MKRTRLSLLVAAALAGPAFGQAADPFIATGQVSAGGIVTDTAGFAAACYHRGVPVVHVSTTLLGQIDAAIGGKTGVNLPEGKNLVGAFWQPAAVLCDTEVLATLPPREYRSGLGELAKYHFLGGGDLDALPLDERVAACVAIKAAVVAGDEREGGRRATLNYGHTLAHAIEIAGHHDRTQRPVACFAGLCQGLRPFERRQQRHADRQRQASSAELWRSRQGHGCKLQNQCDRTPEPETMHEQPQRRKKEGGPTEAVPDEGCIFSRGRFAGRGQDQE